MKGVLEVFWSATTRLIYDGGLANAGNVALSLLLSLFPFMILIATLVDIWGDPALLEEILILLFDHWPAGSAGPIAEQMQVVLGQAPGELFTFANLIALVLATNGIESARDGLNRAYRFDETRHFVWRRLQGSLFVTLAALALVLAALILVGTPVVWKFLLGPLPWLAPLGFAVGLVQFSVAFLLLWFALFAFHYFLPDGKNRVRDVNWGILLTIACIVVGSQVFAFYLKNLADYASLYGGLAGIMVVIVYLYYFSVVILFGAEFNAALREHRMASANPDAPRQG